LIDENNSSGLRGNFVGESERSEKRSGKSKSEEKKREAAKRKKQPSLQPGSAGKALRRFLQKHMGAERNMLPWRTPPQMQQNRHRKGGGSEEIEREKKTHDREKSDMLSNARRARFRGAMG
jgi:hypothetical protein